MILKRGREKEKKRKYERENKEKPYDKALTGAAGFVSPNTKTLIISLSDNLSTQHTQNKGTQATAGHETIGT